MQRPKETLAMWKARHRSARGAHSRPRCPMRRIFALHVAYLIWALFLGVGDSIAATVIFDGPIKGGIFRSGKSGSELIGFKNDKIRLKNGSHKVWFKYVPRKFRRYYAYIDMKIRVSGSKVTVVDLDYGEDPSDGKTALHRGSNAKFLVGKIDVTWAKPRSRKSGKVTTILLSRLQFKPIGKMVPTEPDADAIIASESCDSARDAMEVHIKSEPSGAQVWLDSEKLGVRSNVVIAAPFCVGAREHANFLLRLSGRVNCSKKVRLRPGKTTILCQMKRQ